jgi:hypothetical protein
MTACVAGLRPDLDPATKQSLRQRRHERRRRKVPPDEILADLENTLRAHYQNPFDDPVLIKRVRAALMQNRDDEQEPASSGVPAELALAMVRVEKARRSSPHRTPRVSIE